MKLPTLALLAVLGGLAFPVIAAEPLVDNIVVKGKA